MSNTHKTGEINVLQLIGQSHTPETVQLFNWFPACSRAPLSCKEASQKQVETQKNVRGKIPFFSSKCYLLLSHRLHSPIYEKEAGNTPVLPDPLLLSSSNSLQRASI